MDKKECFFARSGANEAKRVGVEEIERVYTRCVLIVHSIIQINKHITPNKFALLER